MFYYKLDAEAHSDWGVVTYYLEVDEDSWAIRQIEVYENGVVLFYDYSHPSDAYGALAGQLASILLEGLGAFEIAREEFEHVWHTLHPHNW